MDDHAYPIGDGLCIYAHEPLVFVGRIDADCRCTARAVSNMTGVWQVIEIDKQKVRIRYLGGSRFEVVDEGRTWSLDSTRDNGDYCQPGKPTS